jgi:ribosomal protein S18 acetylase RimI-like enzyme
VNFDYSLEKTRTKALNLDYFLVPWDTEILQQSVAEIRNLEVRNPCAASHDFRDYIKWRGENAITFCYSRIAHSDINESMFLQAQGFRFIELNYHPRLDKLQELEIPDDEIIIEPVVAEDKMPLAEIAGSIFKHGRFHQDPELGVALGDRRYKTWLLNAFELPHQQVLKCSLGHEIIAFFVVEYPQQNHCFWSLIGMAPGMQGKGLGKRAWRSMMHKHQREGVETITTSISSHNIAVLNLYVSLAFRFTVPYATFHWHCANTQT